MEGGEILRIVPEGREGIRLIPKIFVGGCAELTTSRPQGRSEGKIGRTPEEDPADIRGGKQHRLLIGEERDQEKGLTIFQGGGCGLEIQTKATTWRCGERGKNRDRKPQHRHWREAGNPWKKHLSRRASIPKKKRKTGQKNGLKHNNLKEKGGKRGSGWKSENFLESSKRVPGGVFICSGGVNHASLRNLKGQFGRGKGLLGGSSRGAKDLETRLGREYCKGEKGSAQVLAKNMPMPFKFLGTRGKEWPGRDRERVR